VAQPKRRRRSKHRGTAAGTIEARGRTGRAGASGSAAKGGAKGAAKAGEKKNARDAARRQRVARLDQPPTWSGAAKKAALMALIFGAAVVLIFGQPIDSAVGIAGFMLLIYVPMSYYTDLFVYRRRQAQKHKRS